MPKLCRHLYLLIRSRLHFKLRVARPAEAMLKLSSSLLGVNQARWATALPHFGSIARAESTLQLLWAAKRQLENSSEASCLRLVSGQDSRSSKKGEAQLFSSRF